MSSELRAGTRYDPAEVEPRIIERWLASGLAHPQPEGNAAENYSIAIPPPNVTGVLHMGHALNNAIQDTLIRHARQQGLRAKWILGTDHAGIATQTKVEQALARGGGSREQLGRERFVQRVWQWRERYGHEIVEQIKRLGSSVDFDDERFTLDSGYAQAVLRVFVALYEKGYIYRDRYLVNWDPGSGSAISDLEVEQREVTDTLYYIDYPLASGDGSVTVATVRPETMLADVAVAVNPGDQRYQRLIGRAVELPIVGRELEIIADDYVKPEFGTGALKITPAHDPNDFEISARHGLPRPSVIGEDGRLGGDIPERFRGLDVQAGKDLILSELAELGLINHAEPYTHTVPFSQRSGSRIEPLISLQWFMRMDELAKPAIAAASSGALRFHPEGQRRVYLDWLEKIKPWCISRQLWWGHQLPVWYRGEEVHVGVFAPEGEGWVRDPDVLDTWFSSALWPFATLGWPELTAELRAFYPTDVLVTSRDIVFLWVARMVMMGIEFTSELPFRDVYVHSIIQAPDRRRMSKSLGTGIDPRALIDGGPRPPAFAKLDLDGAGPGEFPAYGADAVRWGLLAMSGGQDVPFNEERVSQAHQLTNKLWNASRLIIGAVEPGARARARPTTVEDRWILSRLERTRASLAAAIERFEFARAALELYDFIYAELCDWYLELVKPRLRGREADTQTTVLHVLVETVTLAHPLIPFVTEEIYANIPGAEGLLAQRVAVPDAAAIDAELEAPLQRAITAIQAVRAWRDGADVKPSAILPARLLAEGYGQTSAQIARLGRLRFDQADRAGTAPGGTLAPNAAPASAALATVTIPDGAIEIMPSPEVDAEAIRQKGHLKRVRLESEIQRARGKLANAGFLAKAPRAVVESERAKLAMLMAELEALGA